METLRNDIKHAWRMFRENKLFTATAIAALTLGIGVNIAIFSVVNAVLLKPVPFPEPDTLVQLVNTNNGTAVGPAVVAGEVHALARPDRRARACRRGAQHRDEPRARRRARGHRCGSNDRGVRRCVPAAARHGPVVHGRGGSAERGLHRRPELQLLDAALGLRSERARQERHVVRQPVHDRRRRRPRVRRSRFRPRARGLGAVPARSEHGGPRSLLSNGRAPQARRLARAGASAADGVGSGFSRPLHGGRDAGDSRLQRDHTPGGARAPGAADAARRARRRRLRAADRVRERREPAARPRDGAAPRAGRARRARRGPLAHHAAAADREPDAVVRGRRARPRSRAISACARC